ncbi:MAG: four helix bundle protein [Gemmatimonadota bacterium]|nr:four helix bundle protein [Gemmatimonadota bacterium]
MGNLRVLERAFHVADLTYRATRAFPAEEKFGLVSQMRRAAVSVGSNVAEGCGRSSERQFRNFLQIAAGSASELEFQARLSIRLGIGSAGELQTLIRVIGEERKMLGALCARLTARLKSEARSADAG